MVYIVVADKLENYSQMNIDSITVDPNTLPCNLYTPRKYYILTRPGENIPITYGGKNP